ncbi:MAG TPA: 50S ribosomal protein L21e [Candidatus Nanoarchaeia archaeon]|nr:50S ribosomal protein L21e [Candidatus Nanoarchaeia archaeon]
MQRIGSFRRKSRHKLQKDARRKGKISLTRYFQAFNDGDKVFLLAEPAVHEGMYFPRFHGRSGIITGKRGKCYHVRISDMDKEKVLIVHPAHLKRC